MKSQQLRAEAERLYMEQCTFGEIAARLDVVEKTVRLWADAGRWREKREKFLQERESLGDKMLEFTNQLMDSIMQDWAEGNKVDPGRLYALTRLVDKIEKAKKVTASLTDEQTETVRNELGFSEETLKQFEQQMKMM